MRVPSDTIYGQYDTYTHTHIPDGYMWTQKINFKYENRVQKDTH